MHDCHRCDLGLEENSSHAFYYCPPVRFFWDYVGELSARIAPEKIVFNDLAYSYDNVSPPYSVVKCMVFLKLLALARMVI